MRGVGPRMKGPVPQRKRIVLSLAIYGARPDPEAVLRELLPHLEALGWTETSTGHPRVTRRCTVVSVTLDPSPPTKSAAPSAAGLFAG